MASVTMDMKNNLLSGKKGEASDVLIYPIREIVDASCCRLQADGDVSAANSAGWMHIRRQVCHSPPGSVIAELLFVFDPDGDGRDRQSRLRPYLRIKVSDPIVAKAMSVLVERGPLSGFYKFTKMNGPLILPASLNATLTITAS